MDRNKVSIITYSSTLRFIEDLTTSTVRVGSTARVIFFFLGARSRALVLNIQIIATAHLWPFLKLTLVLGTVLARIRVLH